MLLAPYNFTSHIAFFSIRTIFAFNLHGFKKRYTKIPPFSCL